MNMSINKTRRSASVRRGMTLVELITVISVSSVLLSILTTLVVQVTRFESKTRGRISETIAIAQLSDHFREDVRRASSVELISESGESPAKLVLSIGDSAQVHYRQSGRGIDREKHQGTEVVARDRYRLPARANAQWSQQQVEDVEFVQLDLVLEISNEPLFRFLALVGRHRDAEASTTLDENDGN